MQRWRAVMVASALAVLLLLPGCWVYSVYPLAESEQDLIFDKQLVGTWVQPDDGCSLTITRFFNESAYHVVYAAPGGKTENGCLVEPGNTAVFKGGLVDIGGRRYLDLFPIDRHDIHHTTRLHSFYKLKVEAGSLALTPMNVAWLDEQLHSNSLPVAAMRNESGIILSAPTRELRAFLQNYGERDEVFTPDTRVQFRRKPES